jgi:hypothetical protein
LRRGRRHVPMVARFKNAGEVLEVPTPERI